MYCSCVNAIGMSRCLDGNVNLFDLMSPMVARLSVYIWGNVLIMGSRLALVRNFLNAHALLLTWNIAFVSAASM